MYNASNLAFLHGSLSNQLKASAEAKEAALQEETQAIHDGLQDGLTTAEQLPTVRLTTLWHVQAAIDGISSALKLGSSGGEAPPTDPRSVNKMPIWEAYLKLKEDSQRTPEEVRKRYTVLHSASLRCSSVSLELQLSYTIPYSPLHGRTVDAFFVLRCEGIENHRNLEWCKGKKIEA